MTCSTGRGKLYVLANEKQKSVYRKRQRLSFVL